MKCHTSRVVPSPTAAGDKARRFRFAFQDSRRREVQAKRRQAIADYLDGWAGSQIVAEEREAGTLLCWVTFTTAPRLPIKAVAAFIKECPHVADGTFRTAQAGSPSR
jgi:hypothetical protein